MNFLSKFEAHLQHSKLIKPRDKIFVACSGGPDSTALFYLLMALRTRWKLKVALVHFNHQLRGRASYADERFVENLAQKFKIPFYGKRGSVKKLASAEKLSEEEAARMARYRFFEAVARQKKVKKIVTAHTLEDQAETVLMRLLQGTGLRGLCGIRESFRQGGTIFIRPLLSFSKKDILDFLKENRISFREDASNRSLRYLRNRIRLKLIPFLEKEFNPRVTQALARVPASLTEEAEVLSGLEDAAWKQIFLRRKGMRIFLSRKRFLKLPAPLQFRILEKGLRRLDSKAGLGFDAWQRLRTGLRNAHYRHSLPKDIDFVLTPVKLMLYKKRRKEKGDRLLLRPGPQK